MDRSGSRSRRNGKSPRVGAAKTRPRAKSATELGCAFDGVVASKSKAAFSDG